MLKILPDSQIAKEIVESKTAILTAAGLPDSQIAKEIVESKIAIIP